MNLSLAVHLVLLLCTSFTLASYEDARCKCVCVNRQGSDNNTKPTGKIYVKAIAADQCSCKLMLGDESDLCPYCDCKYQVRNTTTIKVVVCLILVIISALTLYMIFLLLLEPLLSARRAGYKATTANDSPPSVPDSAAATAATAKPMQIRSRWYSPGESTMWTTTSVEQLPAVEPDDSLTDECLLLAVQNQSEVQARTRQRVPKAFGDVAGEPVSGPSIASSASASAVAPSGGVSTVVKSVRDQQQRWKGDVEAQRARVFSEHTLLN